MIMFTAASSLVTRLRANMRRDPVRDWFVLLAVSAIALVSLIVWNAWTFDTIAGGGVIGAPTGEAAPVFSRSSLDTVRRIFEERAAEEAKYRTGAYRFVDPSQ